MEKPAPERRSAQWALAGAGLLMIALAGVVALHRRSPAPPPDQPAQRVAGNTATPLYVQHDGPALRLHWSPEAPAVRTAHRGVLAIVDGAHESRLTLNAEELRSGMASYWPQSGEVAFRLELDGAPAGTIRASAEPEEPRPSPFERARKPRKPRPAAQPVNLVPSPPPAEPEVDEAPPSKKPSRFGRVVGKIPLLRRLKRH